MGWLVVGVESPRLLAGRLGRRLAAHPLGVTVGQTFGEPDPNFGRVISEGVITHVWGVLTHPVLTHEGCDNTVSGRVITQGVITQPRV